MPQTLCAACSAETGRHTVQVALGDGQDDRFRQRRIYGLLLLCNDCNSLMVEGEISWDIDHGWVRDE